MIPMAVFEKPQGDYTPNVVIEAALTRMNVL